MGSNHENRHERQRHFATVIPSTTTRGDLTISTATCRHPQRGHRATWRISNFRQRLQRLTSMKSPLLRSVAGFDDASDDAADEQTSQTSDDAAGKETRKRPRLLVIFGLVVIIFFVIVFVNLSV